MRAIFISYRRSDSEGEAGRLSDLLTSRFSDQSVFMDVDSIKPGYDFRRAIEESIQACSVVLVLIGPGWLETPDDHGGRRIDAPNDYVRLEIAAALHRDIPVIPILVRGARMPQAEQLPFDIRDLAYRNSVELTHARWKLDLQVLTGALDNLLQKPAAPAPAPRPATPTPAPATYLHATAPAPLHTSSAPLPVTTRPGPSARRAAYTNPLPRSPFADTPSVYRAPARPGPTPAATTLPPRTANPAPSYIPPPHPPAAAPPEPRVLPPVSSLVPRPVEAVLPAEPTAPRPQPEATPLPAAVIDRVSKELAHFIGPIAEIVVKRAAKRTASPEDLYEAVSHEIESAPDRARFLAQCRK